MPLPPSGARHQGTHVSIGPGDRIVLAAATWAVLFGSLHVAWAAGSRLLIDDAAAASIAFERTWFQVYNTVVILGSLAAAVIALASVHRVLGGHRWVRRLLWAVAGVLIVRGGIGAAQLGYEILTRTIDRPMLAWSIDLAMLVGGALFVAAARSRGARRGQGPPASAAIAGSVRSERAAHGGVGDVEASTSPFEEVVDVGSCSTSTG